jgi:hypothetical protein
VVAVKAPGFGDNRKANLQDLAVLTGGQVVSEELGQKLEDTQMKDLGRAKKIIISKDDTIIMDGAGDKDAIKERSELIRESYVAPPLFPIFLFSPFSLTVLLRPRRSTIRRSFLSALPSCLEVLPC